MKSMSNGPRTTSWAISYIDKDIKVNVREFIYNVASPLTQAHVRVGAQYALDISVVPFGVGNKKHNTTKELGEYVVRASLAAACVAYLFTS